MDKKTLKHIAFSYAALQAMPYVSAQMPHNMRSLSDDRWPYIPGHPAIHAPRVVGMLSNQDGPALPEPDFDDDGIANMVSRINASSTSVNSLSTSGWR